MDSVVVIVALGAALAGFVQGLSGFAFAMAAAAVWAWAVPPQLTAPLLVFGSWLGQLLAVPAMRQGFRLKAVAPFVVGGLAGVPAGVAILPHLDPVWFKFAIGLFLAVYCPTMLVVAARRASTEAPPAGATPVAEATPVADGVVGFGGGVLGGIAGMTGALPTLWCTLKGRDRHEARAVIQSFNLTMHTTTLTAYTLTGTIDREALWYFAVVAPAMLIPTLLGARLYRRISDRGFRQLVLMLLTLAGLTLLAGSVPVLVARLSA